MSIQAGELKQRITIVRETRAADALGQLVASGSPTTVAANLPAKVESVAGGETVRGRQVVDNATILFTIRWLAGVLTTDSVVYDGVTYGILRAQDPYGDHRELRIEATA